MTYEWGSKAAAVASNKFKEGLTIKSKRIMAIGVQMLISSIEESLEMEKTFESLAGLSEFWNFITATEMTSDKLKTLPKEFQSVLSSGKMLSTKKGEISKEIKDVLREVKEIVHVGELMQGKEAENKEGFVNKSKVVLEECKAKLKKIT
jgi:hypothetical protein